MGCDCGWADAQHCITSHDDGTRCWSVCCGGQGKNYRWAEAESAAEELEVAAEAEAEADVAREAALKAEGAAEGAAVGEAEAEGAAEGEAEGKAEGEAEGQGEGEAEAEGDKPSEAAPKDEHRSATIINGGHGGHGEAPPHAPPPLLPSPPPPPHPQDQCDCKWADAQHCITSHDDGTRCWSVCCGYEGHNYPQPPKAELQAAEKAEADADAEREAVLKAATEAPRCGPNEICHVSPAEAMVAEKALAKQLAAAEAAAEAAAAEAAAAETEADAATPAKEEPAEEVAAPAAGANATAANATAMPSVRTPLLSWRPTNQTGPTDEPRVHGSKGRVRDRTVLKLELFGTSYRRIGGLQALDDERWYAQPSPEPKTVEPQPNPHPHPNPQPLLLTRYSELSLEAVMGTSPYRLPVLNVSSGPSGAMKVEVDGRRLRASTGALAP